MYISDHGLVKMELLLTLFLPGEGRISPLIVYHVTKSVRNRVNDSNVLVAYSLEYQINAGYV